MSARDRHMLGKDLCGFAVADRLEGCTLPGYSRPVVVNVTDKHGCVRLVPREEWALIEIEHIRALESQRKLGGVFHACQVKRVYRFRSRF